MRQFTFWEGHLRFGGELIPLTPKERAVFAILVGERGDPVPSEALIQQVWGESPIGSESLHRCMSTLRSKLARRGAEAAIITLYGYGYRLGVEIDSTASPAQAETRQLAMEGFRQAMEILGRRSKPEIVLGRQRLAKVRADHPDFLPAYAFGAHAEIASALLNYDDPAESGQRALALAADILSRDPHSADALAVGGFVAAVIRGESSGFDDLDQAVARDGSNWMARYYRGWALAGQGHFRKAIDDFDTAWREHSEALGILGAYAYVLFCAGKSGEALELLRKASAPAQLWASVNAIHAIIASTLGFHDEAIAAGRRVAAIPHMSGTLVSSLAFALARAGQKQEAHAMLEQIVDDAELGAAPVMIAPVYLALEDEEAARAVLDRGEVSQDPFRHFQRFDPRLSALRG